MPVPGGTAPAILGKDFDVIKNTPGMETHVCVYQTVRELCARGVRVHVPIDGVASRREDHRLTGIELCRAAGATITTMETVVFDWLRIAGTEPFKQLSKLIR